MEGGRGLHDPPHRADWDPGDPPAAALGQAAGPGRVPGPPRFRDRGADLPPDGMTIGTRRPLSVFTYYLRNKRKVVPLLLIMTLAVALMVVVQSLVSSARDTAMAIYGSYSNVEVVAPRVKSQVDADKQLTDALALLSSERAAVATAAAPPPSDSLAGLAQVLQQLRAVPDQLRAAEAADAAAAQAAIPSTAPLPASLGSAGRRAAAAADPLARTAAGQPGLGGRTRRQPAVRPHPPRRRAQAGPETAGRAAAVALAARPGAEAAPGLPGVAGLPGQAP